VCFWWAGIDYSSKENTNGLGRSSIKLKARGRVGKEVMELPRGVAGQALGGENRFGGGRRGTERRGPIHRKSRNGERFLGKLKLDVDAPEVHLRREGDPP